MPEVTNIQKHKILKYIQKLLQISVNPCSIVTFVACIWLVKNRIPYCDHNTEGWGNITNCCFDSLTFLYRSWGKYIQWNADIGLTSQERLPLYVVSFGLQYERDYCIYNTVLLIDINSFFFQWIEFRESLLSVQIK